MNYTDFAEVFSRHNARVAILSTYDFDPLYFEKRLLFSDALVSASRIVIFMDKGRYQRLVHSDARARYLNERYLIVPVRPSSDGVFHAKLNLLVREDGATLFCGSNNLTQAGCTQNLEIINAIDIQAEDQKSPYRGLLRDTVEFYKGCLDLCAGSESRVAKQFLSDLLAEYPWLCSGTEGGEVYLAHTLKKPLLPVLQAELGDRSPSRLLVVSPFFDQDLRLLKHLRTLWPGCPVDIVAQEQTGNLPARALGRYGRGVKLFRLHAPKSRRLHAKLVVLINDGKAICCSGSANFTTAAFNGLNVEACLIIRKPATAIDGLFDKELRIERVQPDEFDTGKDEEPTAEVYEEESLVLQGAAISTDQRLSLRYVVKDPNKLKSLKIALRAYGEEYASKMRDIPINPSDFCGMDLSSDNPKEFQQSLQCYLEGRDKHGRIVKSLSVWVIQESRLTRVFAGADGGEYDRERIIRETGQGTTEYLDALAKQKGTQAVIEFLQNLNIKFQSDLISFRNQQGFMLAPSDPTRSDVAPEWTQVDGSTLESAIFDFVDRHHHKILRKHARLGNINGMANFMDVFIECNKLMFLYYRRGLLNSYYAIDKILRGISILTNGMHSSEEEGGFIDKIRHELPDEDERIAELLRKYSVLEHLCVALLMAQFIRCETEKSKTPHDFLLGHALDIGEFIRGICLPPQGLVPVLSCYRFLTDDERVTWNAEYLQESFV